MKKKHRALYLRCLKQRVTTSKFQCAITEYLPFVFLILSPFLKCATGELKLSHGNMLQHQHNEHFTVSCAGLPGLREFSL